MHALSLQSCQTLCGPVDCSLPGSSAHGDSPGKNTGVGCHALLQGIFPTQGSNLHLLCLLYWKQILYHQRNMCLCHHSPWLLLLLSHFSRVQLCVTGSPPGSPVPGILQARTLERVAISFSKYTMSSGGSAAKETACQRRRHIFDPWVGKIPWSRKWQPAPFLP